MSRYPGPLCIRCLSAPSMVERYVCAECNVLILSEPQPAFNVESVAQRRPRPRSLSRSPSPARRVSRNAIEESGAQRSQGSWPFDGNPTFGSFLNTDFSEEGSRLAPPPSLTSGFDVNANSRSSFWALVEGPGRRRENQSRARALAAADRRQARADYRAHYRSSLKHRLQIAGEERWVAKGNLEHLDVNDPNFESVVESEEEEYRDRGDRAEDAHLEGSPALGLNPDLNAPYVRRTGPMEENVFTGPIPKTRIDLREVYRHTLQSQMESGSTREQALGYCKNRYGNNGHYWSVSYSEDEENENEGEADDEGDAEQLPNGWHSEGPEH